MSSDKPSHIGLELLASARGPATPAEVLPRAAIVERAIASRDLDGHLAVLILHSGFGETGDGAWMSPWTTGVEELLSHDPVATGSLRRPLDVAIVGVQLALGGAANRRDEYATAARRELEREPLPPAACVRDDERLLLGIAAGIGAAAPELAEALSAILRAREQTVTLRQRCLDLWAESLAQAGPSLTPETAERAARFFRAGVGRRLAVTDDDRIAMFWLATRLLEAPWTPSDEDLAILDGVISAGQRCVLTLMETRGAFELLDAAFVLDGLSATPRSRLARKSALEGVLAVIDNFPASSAVLSTRQRARPPFVVGDEYDVQDLFHAVVLPVVPDIVPEDPAPKVAGKSTRLDFTSKRTRLGFELKHVKSEAHAKDVRQEILLDERTYQEHPYVETVVVFVHDPHCYIPLSARASFEADLTKHVTVSGRTVRYVTRVR